MMTPPARLATTQERVRARRPQPPAACTCRGCPIASTMRASPVFHHSQHYIARAPPPAPPQEPPSPCTSPRQTPPRRACSPASACRAEPVTPWPPRGYLTPAPARTRTTLSSWSTTTRPSTSSPTRPPWRPGARGPSPAVGTRRPRRLTRGRCVRIQIAVDQVREPQTAHTETPGGARRVPACWEPTTRTSWRSSCSLTGSSTRSPAPCRRAWPPRTTRPKSPCRPPPRRWPSSGAWPQTSRTPRHPSRSPWPTT